MNAIETIALVGIGLIGSSIAHNIRRRGLARRILVIDSNATHGREAVALGLADEAFTQIGPSLGEADLTILCSPVGTYASMAPALGMYLSANSILSDVGSVKASVVDDVAAHLPPLVHFVPGHPIAGTEKSGPGAGFLELFENRWTILTPLEGGDPGATQALTAFWEGCGAKVALMNPQQHDTVLAVTSHLPHLIAYTIVDTAAQLEGSLKSEVIKYSASGFRDFTRIAGSDPTMWRDIFLTNKDAVLDVLQRFSDDLDEMKRAIEGGDGQALFDSFTETRRIRHAVVAQGQAGTFDPREPAPADQGEQVLTPYGGS